MKVYGGIDSDPNSFGSVFTIQNFIFKEIIVFQLQVLYKLLFG